jgi:serine/threonine-protein kinase RsbW
MQDKPGRGVIRLVLHSDAPAVRAALSDLFAALPMQRLPEDDRGTAEIVLAEVLNNIVEHAYAVVRGEIEVTLKVDEGGLACTVVDRGTAMPDGTIPGGGVTMPPTVAGDLPEGGFGWHLIRVLAQDLRYRRVDDRNELTFRLGAAARQ